MGIRRDILRAIEAGVMGLFLWQAIRFLYGTLYAHVSSADLTRRILDQTSLMDLPGYVTLAETQREIYAISIALLSPLLALILARTRWSIPLAVSLAAVGRMLTLQTPEAAALASAMVVGAGMLYMALIIIRRPGHFPPMLLLGVSLDLIVRALGHSMDPTWTPDNTIYLAGTSFQMDGFFVALAIGLMVLSGLTTLYEIDALRHPNYMGEKRGYLTGWSSFALGAWLFMELTLFGLANAVANWANLEYHVVVVPLVTVTLAPLIPAVRVQAGYFLAAFQGNWRGWVWMLLIGFLLVIGHRFTGLVSLVVLVTAQLLLGLVLWWYVRLRDELWAGNPTPILMLVSLAVFGLLSGMDYFTYDYAYVRPFAAPLSGIDEVLRAMRDMGLQIFLFATLLACLPMLLERRVIPWRGGREGQSFVSLLLVVAISFGTTALVGPTPVAGPSRANCFRVATLNIHSGYTLLFDENVREIAQSIQRSGADIVLLQEVDRGRLSSFGVDQAHWLAHELNMNISYFPQNEYMQGLVILSRLPIQEAIGQELPSTGAQAGVLHVILQWQSQPLHVYNVWLGFRQTDAAGVPLPPNQQDQNRQIDALRRLIAGNHAPNFVDKLILGGTFNYDPESPLYEVWNQTTFEDPFVGLDETRDIRTLFLVDGTSARYDYIWLMNLTANSPNGVGIDQDFVVSDHRLAVVEVIFNPTLTCDGLPVDGQLPDLSNLPSDTPTDEPE
jgi:endonuclease/exonuclease/phosphatase family metal-dependent hydrolase